jgi:type I phosphodiesterase/nucleotide pyrophosphatase
MAPPGPARRTALPLHRAALMPPSRNGRPSGRSALLLLADGARPDVFAQLLDAGELPEIRRHVTERGGFRLASSTFTSTTGPAHLPFLTGCFPGTANVPGIRWFDRTRYREGLPLGPWCLRTYTNPEAWWINRDLSPRVRTLYEVAENPVDVFGLITRGVPRRNRLHRVRKNLLWAHAHENHAYELVDHWSSRYLEEALSIPSELRFIAFPGIDWHSHYATREERAVGSYRVIDAAVGRAADLLRAAGAYDSTLIVVCSDHGHSPVDTHFDLAPRLEADHGLRIAYHSWRLAPPDPHGAVCVSGNGMAHIYLRAGGWDHAPRRGQIDEAYPGVRERLLAEAAVDLVLSRADQPGWLMAESRRGAALLREEPGGVGYRRLSGDPFGLPDLPERLSFDEALAATWDSEYPDVLVQAVQIFRSRRCGDLVLSATPGHDLRQRWERPEHRSSHGALHRAHMSVPLAVSMPLAEGPLRTADVYPTVLGYLGRDLPGSLDGADRRAEGGLPSPASPASASGVA